MNRCIVCDQPLSPNSRTDKITCSHSCRTRRYRQRKDQTNPTGSLPWRRQLHLTQPIHFNQRTPTTHPVLLAQEPDPPRRPYAVPSCYWDTTLVAMNLLCEAYEELEHVLGWPNNKWGVNGNPMTRAPDSSEEDISWNLQGNLDNLHAILDKLRQLRGRVERWLIAQREEFAQRLIELRQEIRIFSQGVEHLYTRYEINYQPGLVAVATALRERVGQWWFTLNDEVD